MDDRLRRSRKQEKRTAVLHEGLCQPGSGNGWARKGDVRTKTTLIEDKRTSRSQITLTDKVLKKIWAEAWAEGRVPLLGFELGGRRYLVINEDDYLEDRAAGAPPVVEPG